MQQERERLTLISGFVLAAPAASGRNASSDSVCWPLTLEVFERWTRDEDFFFLILLQMLTQVCLVRLRADETTSRCPE